MRHRGPSSSALPPARRPRRLPGEARPAAQQGGPEDLIVAEIAAPHGVRGMVRARVWTDFPESLSRHQQVILEQGGIKRIVGLRHVQPHGQAILLQLEGVETMDAAAALRGALVKIPREAAHPLPEGHFYIADIVGLEVLTDDGRSLGPVREVRRTGSNDVYATDSAQIPATREAVLKIDLPGRKMIVSPNFIVED